MSTTPPRPVRNGQTTTEAEFQAQVLELAHLYGWRVLHVRRSIGRRGGTAAWQTTTSVRGWPDLLCWHPDRGACFAAELKSDAGRLTDDQRQVLDQLERCGIDAHVWRPADFDTAHHVLAHQGASA